MAMLTGIRRKKMYCWCTLTKEFLIYSKATTTTATTTTIYGVHSFSQSVSLYVIHIVKGMCRIFSILSYQAHPFPSSTACLGRKRYEWQCRYTKRNQWNKHFAIHDDILLGKSGTSRAVVIAMASLPFHCHQNVSFAPPSHHLLAYLRVFLLLVQMGSFSRFCF